MGFVQNRLFSGFPSYAADPGILLAISFCNFAQGWINNPVKSSNSIGLVLRPSEVFWSISRPATRSPGRSRNSRQSWSKTRWRTCLPTSMRSGLSCPTARSRTYKMPDQCRCPCPPTELRGIPRKTNEFVPQTVTISIGSIHLPSINFQGDIRGHVRRKEVIEPRQKTRGPLLSMKYWFPDAQCTVYLPTFTPKTTQM